MLVIALRFFSLVKLQTVSYKFSYSSAHVQDVNIVILTFTVLPIEAHYAGAFVFGQINNIMASSFVFARAWVAMVDVYEITRSKLR